MSRLTETVGIPPGENGAKLQINRQKDLLIQYFLLTAMGAFFGKREGSSEKWHL